MSLCIVNLTIRSNDETKIIDLCIDTEGRYQIDVGLQDSQLDRDDHSGMVMRHEPRNLRSRDRPPGPRADRRQRDNTPTRVGCLVRELAQRIGSKEQS